MKINVQYRLDKNEALFKWVQYTPVKQLKELSHDELETIRRELSKEVREVGRALQWIDGIINLKTIDSSDAGGPHETE